MQMRLSSLFCEPRPQLSWRLVKDCPPRSSFGKTSGRIRARKLRSAPDSFRNTFDGNPPPEKTSLPAEFQSRSAYRTCRSARVFLLKPQRSFSPPRFHKKLQRDNLARYQ